MSPGVKYLKNHIILSKKGKTSVQLSSPVNSDSPTNYCMSFKELKIVLVK